MSMFVNEEVNEVADKAVDVVIDYIDRNPHLGVQLEIQKVVVYKNDSTNFLNTMCSTYKDMLAYDSPPHLVFDSTRIGYISETVKYFSKSLGLPTVSSSFGEPGDLRQWRMLTDLQQLYLIHKQSPADLIADVLRPMIIHQKIPNAAIFHDDTFVLQHKYKSLFLNYATRHIITTVDPFNIRHQLINARELEIANFFILGNLTTVRVVLETACAIGLLTSRCAWHVILPASIDIKFKCHAAKILLAKPSLALKNQKRMEILKNEYHLTAKPEITAGFYFDLMVHAITAIRNMQLNSVWPSDMQYISCDEYRSNNTPPRDGLNLKKYLDNDIPIAPGKNGENTMQFSMDIQGVEIVEGVINNTVDLATWKPGFENNFTVLNATILQSFINHKFFQVVTVEQKPFIYIDKSSPRGFNGYCIDLLDEIAQFCGFDYDIRLASDGTWGSMDATGKWSGVIRELLENRADIGLGAMSVMAEREVVVDFSIPFYDLVGIGILMKQPSSNTSLFKFLMVMESDVWMCILITYFFTSLLIWIFDRLSPFSFCNNRFIYRNISKPREFSFQECLWFCITSLTPQGGGEAPRCPSGRLVAATWWLFGFIVIASYTANLAAFLTMRRLDFNFDSLEDLSKQYQVTYAPVNGSTAMTYFQRMADIEQRLFEIWQDMSLNDSLHNQKSHLAVWEYPLSDKYIKLWATIQRTGLPLDEATALRRVRASGSDGHEDFAYIGDATNLKYLKMTNCDLRLVGNEFSEKPYAIAIQKGNLLKQLIDYAILTMVNKRQLAELKDKWWSNNPETAVCEENKTSGISIQNIAGIFIVVIVGITSAVLALIVDLWRLKYITRYRTRDTDKSLPPFVK